MHSYTSNVATFLLGYFVGIKNVAFFFSAIATSERNSVRVKEDEIDEESSESDSEIPSTASQDTRGRAVIQKKFFPAITYWIALTTPNGAPANPIVVHRVLLSCGVQVVANQVITMMVFHCLAFVVVLLIKQNNSNKYRICMI